MKIGSKLNPIRRKNKWTLKYLSEQTGLSISYLSDILNDNVTPSLDTLLKLTDIFKVSLSYVADEAVSYGGDSMDHLISQLSDYDTWPEEDRQDLLKYIEAKRALILSRNHD